MPGDSTVVKKKKGRVLDAKTTTQLNSVRVSFVNRKENSDLAARGLRHGLRSVGRVRAPLRGRTGGMPEWAKSRFVGRAVKLVFQIFSELQMLIQYCF